jgi:hypothetical protein
MKTICQLFVCLAIFLGALPQTVQAQVYQFDFTPTQSEYFPLSDYYGSYIILSGPTGNNLDYPQAIVSWNFVTAQGVLNTSNSRIVGEGGGSGISWEINSDQITFSGFAEYLTYETASPYVVLYGNPAMIDEYEVSPTAYDDDGIYGSWQAVTPTPEPSIFQLLIVGFAGFLFYRHRLVSPSKQA